MARGINIQKGGMKVKELIAKYPHYSIIEMGTPRDFPFTNLPKELRGLSGKAYEKVEMELEVKGYEVIAKPHTSIDVSHLIFGGKKRPNKTYDGTLYIYLKEIRQYGHRDIQY